MQKQFTQLATEMKNKLDEVIDLHLNSLGITDEDKQAGKVTIDVVETEQGDVLVVRETGPIISEMLLPTFTAAVATDARILTHGNVSGVEEVREDWSYGEPVDEEDNRDWRADWQAERDVAELESTGDAQSENQ